MDIKNQHVMYVMPHAVMWLLITKKIGDVGEILTSHVEKQRCGQLTPLFPVTMLNGDISNAPKSL
jgi:hypothetical protein